MDVFFTARANKLSDKKSVVYMYAKIGRFSWAIFVIRHYWQTKISCLYILLILLPARCTAFKQKIKKIGKNHRNKILLSECGIDLATIAFYFVWATVRNFGLAYI